MHESGDHFPTDEGDSFDLFEKGREMNVLKSILAVMLMVTTLLAQEPENPTVTEGTGVPLEAEKSSSKDESTSVTLTEEAKNRLRIEFDAIKKARDLKAWQETDVLKPLDASAKEEEKIGQKKKKLALQEFCHPNHFQKLATLEQLDFLTESDKQVCRDRLKTINPQIR